MELHTVTGCCVRRLGGYSARQPHLYQCRKSPPKYDYDAATYGNPVTNNNQYYIKFQGGGLNAEYITTDPSATSGQNTYITTNKNSASGSFYLEDNGGRGFTDNAILMLSISGPIASNFSVNINASGYTWQASPVKIWHPHPPLM